MQPLDFHYFIGSTYTYLTVLRIDEVARRYGREVNWRPFNVRAIMFEQKNIPFRDKPVKAAYMKRDIERRARRHDIPFTTFPDYPIDHKELASRIAVIGLREGWCPAFTKAVYADWFQRNIVPENEANLRKVLGALGQDADRILREAETPEARARLDEETERAKSLGIFGSPSFVSAGEVFWGDDRLEEAMEWEG